MTRVVLRDLYPSKEVLDAAIAPQATSGFGESCEQLDGVLANLNPRDTSQQQSAAIYDEVIYLT